MSVIVYSVDDLIPILRMRRRAVRQLFTSGRLQGRKVGRRWLTSEAAVKLYLRSPEISPPAGPRYTWG